MINEKIKVERFKEQMLIELEHNSYKGSVLEWDEFDSMIRELEYHKAKMFIAIRLHDYLALKEYIADCANILLAIGNKFKLYDLDTQDLHIAHDLRKNIDTIEQISLKESKSRKLTTLKDDTNI